MARSSHPESSVRSSTDENTRSIARRRAVSVILSAVLAMAAAASVACQAPRPDAIYAGTFAYDRAAPLERRDSVETVENGVETRAFSFTSPRGGRATGLLFVPQRAGRKAGIVKHARRARQRAAGGGHQRGARGARRRSPGGRRGRRSTFRPLTAPTRCSSSSTCSAP